MSASQPRVMASRLGHAFKCTSVAAVLSVSAISVSYAQPVSNTAQQQSHVHPHTSGTQAVGMRLGNHGSYQSASIFWQTPVWWTHDFNNGWGKLDLMGEASATYWDAKHGRHSSLWQVGFAPILRWWPTENPFFVEAGFGPTFISRTRFADYGLSTALQFGSHVGVGYVFNKRHQVSLRASHFSNASIKQPNDGLELVQLDYALRF